MSVRMLVSKINKFMNGDGNRKETVDLSTVYIAIIMCNAACYPYYIKIAMYNYNCIPHHLLDRQHLSLQELPLLLYVVSLLAVEPLKHLKNSLSCQLSNIADKCNNY